MRQVLPGIWQWSWFSEEKQLNFNGHLLSIGEHRVLVDPPPMSSEDKSQCQRAGAIDYILITNRDHAREAAVLRTELSCQVYVPDVDSAAMDLVADKTYKDGELLPGGIWAVQLTDQKSPGETALFIPRGKGILIVGDALIRKPGKDLSMLPPDRYADVARAREGLRRLQKYEFDTLLVGDGDSILTGAKQAVESVWHA